MDSVHQEQTSIRHEEYRWFRSVDSVEVPTERQLEALITPVLDANWCSIRHVSMGSMPHRVHFSRPWHTLIIYDRGSFVEGERRLNGVRAGISGPLDTGIDLLPAHIDFSALVDLGSNIASTVITIDPEEITSVLGRSACTELRPALNMGGLLLEPIAARFRQLCQTGEGAIDRIYLETLAMLLFQEVIRTQEGCGSTEPHRSSGGLSANTQRIVRDFLNQNFDTDIDLDVLASQVGLSRFHFSREFKVSFSVPPYRYLLNLRIQSARELLSSTSRSITDIALDVGFQCPNKFTRAFKQAMRCTPSEFRVLNRTAPMISF